MKRKSVWKQVVMCAISITVLFNAVVHMPANEAQAASGGDLYVANYAVVDLAGNELSSISPGTTCTIAVTIIDARVPIGGGGGVPSSTTSTASSVPPPSLNISNVRVRLNPGAFTIPSVDYIVSHIRSDSSGYFSYTVVFNNITYMGGTPNLSFDITYVDGGNNPLGFPLVTVNQPIGQAVDRSVAPSVILKSSSYGGSSVSAGQSFTLTTTAYNTSPNLSIENVIVTVKLPDSLMISSGSNSVVVGTVGPNGEIRAQFALQAKPNAEAGSVPVTVEYTFYAMVQGQMAQLTSTQTISVPVVQQDRFEIYEVEAPEIIMAGEEAYVSLGFANKGKGIIYNLSAEIEGDMDNPGQRIFLGNIAAGTENSVDFYVTASEVGVMEGTIVIKYENAQGEETVIRTPFSITVEEAFYPEYPIDINPPPNEGNSGSITKYLLPLVVVAAAGGGGFYYYKKKKSSTAKAEDEDEDF